LLSAGMKRQNGAGRSFGHAANLVLAMICHEEVEVTYIIGSVSRSSGREGRGVTCSLSVVRFSSNPSLANPQTLIQALMNKHATARREKQVRVLAPKSRGPSPQLMQSSMQTQTKARDSLAT
jgi:hypothetical protein